MNLGDLSLQQRVDLAQCSSALVSRGLSYLGVLPALYRWLGVGTRVQVGYKVRVQGGNSSLTCMVSRRFSVSL
jgi:hypothetical protein